MNGLSMLSRGSGHVEEPHGRLEVCFTPQVLHTTMHHCSTQTGWSVYYLVYYLSINLYLDQ